MAYCDGEISQDILIDCDNLMQRGVEQEGVIINYGDIDIDNVTYSADNPSIITALPLKAGKRGYRVVIPTNNPFTGTGTTLATGTNRNTFNHTVGMVVLANDPGVTENIIDGLANGQFVVVIENKNKNLNTTVAANKGFSTFSVYGLQQGLRATTLEEDRYSEDTDGGWNVVLTETRAPKSGLFFFSTSIEATRTAFNALTGAAPGGSSGGGNGSDYEDPTQ